MNQPYQRARHDSTWNGIAIGAGAGVGMVGATQGGLALMDKYRNRQIKKNMAAGVIAMGSNGPPNTAAMPKGALRGKMFGGRFGWRGAAAYAGAGLLGGALGMGTDYMTD
jgi:hypothetical protein